MTAIECARCHRLSFDWESYRSCPECHWTIRPDPVEKPYGHDVLIAVYTNPITTTAIERHYKGNEATARRRARSVRNFAKVLDAVPLSQEQWERAYGTGHEKWG